MPGLCAEMMVMTNCWVGVGTAAGTVAGTAASLSTSLEPLCARLLKIFSFTELALPCLLLAARHNQSAEHNSASAKAFRTAAFDTRRFIFTY